MAEPPAGRSGLGRWGEEFAARWLAGHGYVVLARNFRSPEGEADIVAVEGGALVVIEVRTRRSLTYGVPRESVTPAKARRLRALLAAYREQHPESPPDERVDFVGITVARDESGPAVELIRNAIESP